MARFVFNMFVIFALTIIGVQAFHWLRTGEWLDIPIAMVLVRFDVPPPKIEWIGLREIVIWLLKLPLALGVFIVGCIIAAPFVLLDDAIESRRAKQAGDRDEISN